MSDKVIYFVTSNKVKFRDARDFMAVNATEDVPRLELVEMEFHEVQTKDLKNIALRKGREAFLKIQKPLFTDDEAVYFEAYPTFPGVLSKYVITGIGFKGLYKIVKPGDRVAMVCEIVYTDANGQQCFNGRVDGIISPWKKEFETDSQPFFSKMIIPNGFDKSYFEIKQDAIQGSFFGTRVLAMEQFLSWWKTYKHKGDF